MAQMDNTSLVQRFIRLPLAQRQTFLEKLASKGMSLANLPIPVCRDAFAQLPLSYAQQRQWFLWQLDPASSAYHVPCALRLHGALDIDALQRSFDALLVRHETLRTCFVESSDGLVQQVQASGSVQVTLQVIAASAQQATATGIETFIEAETRQLFDLQRCPLLRVKLLRLGAHDHVLVLTQHHIICDAASMPVMVDELVQLYAGFSQGQAPELPALPIQYGDYAIWQRQWMEAGEKDRQLAYWTRHLGHEPATLELPSDRPRPAQQSFRGARQDIRIDTRLGLQLHALARQENVTPFMLLLAAFQTLLYRYSGQETIRVGVPVANRNRVETRQLIGFFVNTQVMQTRVDDGSTFRQLLAQVKRHALDAQAHQDLPFEQLVEALQPERSLSHSPLFQVMFNHRRSQAGPLLTPQGLQVQALDWQAHTAQFDLSLDVLESAQGFDCSLSYATDLFDAARIERLARHWQNLLAAIVADPGQPVAELPMLDAQERQRSLYDWNATATRYPLEQSIQHLIEAQVARTPQAPALLFGEQVLSYAQLNTRANRLAHRLIEQGVGADVLVGIAAERSLEMVIGLLAVLKAGGAYVPLDPEYPQERLAYMFEDSGIALLLTQAPLCEQLPLPAGLKVLLLEEALDGYAEDNPEVAVAAENLAYVIYTSGSTGKPKGAGNRHAALTNRLCWMQQAYGLDASDTVLQKTPFSFDVSVWEFFWPLMTGARLAIAGPGDHRDPARLVSLIQQHNVSTLHFVPSMLQAFLLDEQVGQCSGLKRIVCSGEALPVDAQQQVFAKLPQAGLYNLYGPTEAAIDVTHWTCRDEGADSVPIGEPIANLGTYVLSADLEPVAVGVIGELYLTGEGLARGYHRRPGLTAERFVASPFVAGQRLYRTGDLARQRPDGVIEYAGRIDHQVKIRGLRIELGEIEARLLELAEVREAVVLAVEGVGGLQLVGYLVPSDAALLTADAQAQAALRDQLKASLLRNLPDYMVPAHLLFIEQMPLSANGKLERRALPALDLAQVQQTYVAPRSELEQRIAAIWQEVLKRERIGLTDNFFELGGDSIISIQVVSRARAAGIRFTPKALFQHQTVQGLATVASLDDGQLTIDQGPVQGDLPLLPFQRVFFETVSSSQHHWNQSVSLRLTRSVPAPMLERALAVLVAHHDALRLRFVQHDGDWLASHADLAAAEQPMLRDVGVVEGQALLQLANQAQASLDLQHGPLLRALLATLADGSQRLILIIHHLAVDGVSWRVLLEDLQTLCNQQLAGQALQLPAKTSSLQTWARRLQAYARDPALQQERQFWRRWLADAPAGLPCDTPQAVALNRDARHVQTRLDADLTRQLLQSAPSAYRTQVNDLLLTALARVVARWTGQAQVLVQLEGHGREALFDDIDLTRSVGWFTSLYPVKLTVEDDLASSLKAVKEQLRSVANHGIGYAALRYLGDDQVRAELAALPQPRITFNYLGQFDNSFGEHQGALFTPSAESAGDDQHDAAPLANWLSLSGQVYGGELTLNWTFSQAMFAPGTIEALAEAYRQALVATIEHCCQHDNAGSTPSDFPLAGLSQGQLDALPVPARELEELFTLAPMQQGMLFHSLYEQAAGNYINQLRVDIDGLDVARFQAAWQAAVDRHDSLRSGFLWQGELNQPLQFVRRQVRVPFVVQDMRQHRDLDAALDALALAEREQGFDLAQAPLLRVRLVRCGAERHHLIYTHHHILMDGWSSSQLLGEVLQHYAGQPQATASVRYSDYIAWLQAQDAAASHAFWREQTAALAAPTSLAQAIARQADGQAPDGQGEYLRTLDRAAALGEFARQQKVTVNTLVQAAWLLLLQRYTGQPSVAFGATVAGRPAQLRGVEQQIGLFINTLPVIAAPQPQQSVASWLQDVQRCNLALREHEHTPLFEIQRWAGQGGGALFDSILVFESYPVAEALQQAAPQGLRFGEPRNHEQTNYPLTLMVELGERLSIQYRYGQQHFDAATIAQLAQHLENLLVGMITAPLAALGEVPMLAAEEQQRMLGQWNATAREYPLDTPVQQLIAARAAHAPQAPALIFAGQQLSYQALERQANQLAHKLLELGARAGQRVGIALERGPDMIVALLAVLKAGAAYVPLDPSYPEERLAYMMTDSGMDLLLSHSQVLERLPVPAKVRALALDHRQQWLAGYADTLPAVAVDAQDLAYVIYTSGSTGKPKGVMVRHGALANFIASMIREPGFCAADRMLSLTTFSFDIFGLEIYAPLVVGASVVLIDEAVLHDSDALLEVIQNQGVTLVQATPSSWRMLLDNPRSASLAKCRLLCGGEALPKALAERMLDVGAGVWNLYGPTETTIWSALHVLSAEHPTPWLGRPIDNTAFYLLGDDLLPVPAGVSGEMLIGGSGLARGYFERPSLTAERFVPDPYSATGERLYRTGDLGRYHHDGVLEYIGRLDHQVKVRGLRIELGEIEAALLAQPAVRDAAVLAVEGQGGMRLVGYVVAHQAPPGNSSEQQRLGEMLAAQLLERLPDYMVPVQWLFLERLPLTPNGKLDRKALPRQELASEPRPFRAPGSALEQQVAAIWQAVLDQPQVGLDDDFFALGGHSLLATQAISRVRHALKCEVPLKLLFEHSVLAGFVQALDASTGTQAPPLQALAADQPLLLSYAQERQWFLWQLQPDSTAYHVPSALRLRGALDEVALQRSFDTLVARHASLRTVFAEDAERVLQVVHQQLHIAVQTLHLDVPDEAGRDAQIDAFIDREVRSLFDLRQGPLLRVKLLQLTADDHVLLIVQHHIICDGWSVQVMIDELVQLYAGYSLGQEVALPALPIGYADFANWQRQWMDAGERQRQLDYWTAQLPAPHPVLQLPSDRPRPARQSYRGARQAVQLSEALAAQLTALARCEGVTLYMLLLASLQVLLHRYSGQDDIRVGVANANRNRLDTERLIGFFVNTQVLQASFDEGPTFRQLLAQVKRHALDAQAHQDLPFEQLVEALQPERSLGHSPLFQVMFNHQSEGRAERVTRELPGLEIQGLLRDQQTAQFDLTLETFEAGQQLAAAFTYATDLFDAARIERLARHWQNLLAAIVADPAQPVAELPMLDAQERQRSLYDWNATATRYPLEQSIQHLIEAQVARTPQAPALLFGEQVLSYAQLNARANRLAHRLIEQGVGADVLVGIAAERSLEMVIGLLAVLKAGGAYVPLDPEYPQERLAYMFEDSGIALLLTQAPLREQLPLPAGLKVLLLEEALDGYAEDNPEVAVAAENLAYVIYTSGSTGKPKGAGNRHAALTNRLCWMQQAYGLDASDTVLQKTPFSFDVSVWEFFWPLMTGARLAIAGPGDHRDPARLVSLIQQHDVSTLHFVPSMLQAFLLDEQVGQCTGLKRIVCSGEALPVDAQQQVFAKLPQAGLYNLYGPTEAAIDVTHWTCRDEGADSVPIGEPIANLGTYVLSADLEPVAVGVIGELYLTGEGLARGYHRRPGLTAERFVASPFVAGQRLYRTGDLARQRPDGVIEYAGRIDHQVKIRGLRIELGEIEARLLELAEVREAVVLAVEGVGGLQLVGYLVPSDAAVLTADAQSQAALRDQLKASLLRNLPDYMVPTHLLFIEQMPLSANGKLERRALPGIEALLAMRSFRAPQTELECQVAAVWAQLLGVEQVGLDDDFFSLGGHSLLATQLIARVREQLGVEVELKSVFTATRLDAFCDQVQAAKTAHSPLQDELAKSLEALKRLSGDELEQLIS
ncbi:amino acid adenylation domain-containing protein [Pseudomonas tructae]|uniref:Amino acid adenylation domain-containing protein n=1 Tax=Pseudomonas tructae TaxID=2518644 RepID=A0A411ML55_9PSED|nr:non-ribosomal peptide synthase/polyketide synthase [Pseudomonas tructae]QBF27507.1 amino acid adenylation domain-containing protein [Pseudomonas tructae]